MLLPFYCLRKSWVVNNLNYINQNPKRGKNLSSSKLF